jgi:N-acetylglucosaminyl-diphospho-decaprenol L-rhamnosyltransferase
MSACLSDIDVVIVAHDAGDLLLAAVRSVVVDVAPEHVWVMDAESRDDAPAKVAETVGGINVVRVPNRGFGASNNAGIALGESRYVLLLNPDAELLPGALQALNEYVEVRPEAGVVGAKVLNPDGSRQANQFGHYPSLPQVFGLRVWRAWQKARGNADLSPADFDTPRRVQWVTGACMFARREVLDEVGGFDEGFFLYYEDTDLCHRVRDAGHEVVVVPRAHVVHRLGQAGGKSAAAQKAYRDSFYRYCDKYGLWGLRAVARLLVGTRS